MSAELLSEAQAQPLVRALRRQWDHHTRAGLPDGHTVLMDTFERVVFTPGFMALGEGRVDLRLAQLIGQAAAELFDDMEVLALAMIFVDGLHFVHGASAIRGGTLVFFWFTDLQQGMVATVVGNRVSTAKVMVVQAPAVQAVA
jgi:hypothetical protein